MPIYPTPQPTGIEIFYDPPGLDSRNVYDYSNDGKFDDRVLVRGLFVSVPSAALSPLLPSGPECRPLSAPLGK